MQRNYRKIESVNKKHNYSMLKSILEKLLISSYILVGNILLLMSLIMFDEDNEKNNDEICQYEGVSKQNENRSKNQVNMVLHTNGMDEEYSEDEIDEEYEDNADRVDTVFCEENVTNNMKYDQEMKSDILLGLSTEHACITHSVKCLVDKRFINKTLHVYATSFRSAMCYLTRLQVENRVLKGMGRQQAINESERTFSTLNLKAFLFEEIPNSVLDKDRVFEKLIAKLNWNADLDETLKTIRYRQDFISVQDKITVQYLDENFMMPRPLRVQGANKAPVVSVIISIFAAIRIHQYNVSPETAFDLVIKSRGIDARVFFG